VLTTLLLIGLGSALGGMLRHWMAGVEEVGLLAARELPWGTILVNLTGSFLIGYFIGLPPTLISDQARLFFIAGFCGGYTTFSSFSLQNIELLRDGEVLAAMWNILLSLIAGMVVAIIGYRIGSQWA